MSRCVVVGGAEIKDYERVRGYLNSDDFVVYCDCGLKHKDKLYAQPNLIVGDFDSYDNPNLDAETIVLPCEKDDTDTVYAVKCGIKRGFTEFLLLGVVGQRMDHTLANVSILLMLDSLNLKGTIIDDYSEMSIVSKSATVEDSFRYFSLLNISGEAKGVTIKNAKYPLENGEIACDYQYGVSNEVIKGTQAEITLSSGKLLLIKISGE